MNEEHALLKAICADPDDDTARLVYADWLDENRPDPTPSPAAGPSARAEYIRVQCRLATSAFDSPDYPELLEREADLATWLTVHSASPSGDDESSLELPDEYDCGEWGEYRRGFPEVLSFDDYGDSTKETVETIARLLNSSFSRCPARTLRLVDATENEVTALTRHTIFRRLRGLYLDYLDGGGEDAALAAIASSPHSAGLRRLYLDLPLNHEGCAALARSRYLGNLESLVIDYPLPTPAIKALARGKWFRNLRRLHLWPSPGDPLRCLAELPSMPRLLSLSVRGGVASPTPTGARRFAASRSFPNLAHLDLSALHMSPDDIAGLARGRWPLRHLDLGHNAVRKAGVEALAAAPFLPTVCVLDLRHCEITAGSVQTLADTPAVAGLRHLDLYGNPIGSGGLAALAASPYLRGLRLLDLGRTNSARGPIAARDVVAMLAALDTPDLRELTLNGLPVGIRGAKAIAAGLSFARLTRLNLDGCSVGDDGAGALAASKTLTDLVVLDLSMNKLGAKAGKLANPKVFPRLARCYLDVSRIPEPAVSRLLRRPAILEM